MTLIDAEVFGGKIESLIEWVDINLEEDRFSEGCKASLKDALSTLKYYTPTVDAVPVVHGHWVRDDSTGEVRCSKCNDLAGATSEHTYNELVSELYYCSNCGAKMDGKVEDG